MTKRQHIASIIAGLAAGALLVTLISKTIMEAGIAVLSGFAAIGTGFLVGKLAFPKKKRLFR